jgi:aspartyl-tRNA synthetase
LSDVPSPATRATSLRSLPCGALRASHIGQRVRLGGWVQRSRDLGGLLFIDLRDRDGIVQLAFGPPWADPMVSAAAAAVATESVVLVEGLVVAREPGAVNPELGTGEVEVRCDRLEVVGPAQTPPIPVVRGKGEKLAAEELRLRHRVHDLRRAELQANLRLRHTLLQATRRYLSDHGFLEVETPILTKPTPEGARDYLVPSRVHPGEFYALPQSPQLYKQLLMVAGYDRYFQIARCFRDEDLRADRQPEFTQIDVEASFVARDDVMALMEGLIGALWASAGRSMPSPVRRMAYAEAMERYGCDRPDLRYGLELRDVSAVFATSEFSVARDVIAAGGRVRGLVAPGAAGWSRKQVDELETIAKQAGAGGLIRLKRTDAGLEGPVAKFLDAATADALGIGVGDLGLFVAAPDAIANPALDRVRQEVAARLELVDPTAEAFVWVVDFPMFGRAADTGALEPLHHPFTAPSPEHTAALLAGGEADATTWTAQAYDLVYNGVELGGGSIRIADPRVQERVFTLLGFDAATAERKFGFLLEGLRAGAPPHGGIAFGFDRIAMMLAGAASLRDVIAFPKTTAARALFEGAPTPVAGDDLAVLHLRTVGGDG